MKPAFAIVDWDMFALPVVVYVGPDDVPKSLMPEIRRACRQSRYGANVVTPESVMKNVSVMADDDRHVQALTVCDEELAFIRIWTYDDAVLCHELVHVIGGVCRRSGIADEEFSAYALQWLFKDFVEKLTWRFYKPFSFRRDR